ncbi:MAG: hypothetical protein H7A01_03045 [Hahellaceae bacterium]|nr:hypothetical protein [Hahellaceae bacterium]MCP5212380.1 hypothetical protein [Hahellaceae bacterium]
MENQHKETLSALVDNEIDDLEWRRLRGVSSDEICAQWRSYNQLSESIRGVRTVSVDVSASVSAAIAQLDNDGINPPGEAVADAQGFTRKNRLTPESDARRGLASAKTSTVDRSLNSDSSKSAWVTLAVAASFAFVSVMLFQLLQANPASDAGQSFAVVDQPSGTGSLLSVDAEEKLLSLLKKMPVNIARSDAETTESQKAMDEFTQRPDLLAKSSSVSQRDQLNEYLLRHAGAGFLGTPQGVAPYARLASFSTNNRAVMSE